MAAIDILFESALLLAAVCFSLSLYVASRGVTNKLNLSYAALTFNISIWAFSFFVSRVLSWRFFESIHFIATLLIPGLALHTLGLLLTPRSRVFQFLQFIAWIVPGALIPLVIFGLDRYPVIRDMSYYSPSLVTLGSVYLFLIDRGSGISRRKIMILGGAFVTIICVLDRIDWLGRTIPAIGNLLLVIYFYFIKDIVLQQRLVSTRGLAGRLLSQAASALALGMLYILLTTWVKHNQLLFTLNIFLAAFVGVMSVDPLRSLFTMLFQKFFFSEATRISRLIQQASKEIAGAFHDRAIATVTARVVQESMHWQLRGFYALDSFGQDYLRVDISLRTEKNSEALPAKLPASFPLVQYWQQQKKWKPILAGELELESKRSALPSRAAFVQLTGEALSGLGARLAIPLQHDQGVLGFALFDSPDSAEWEESVYGILPMLQPYFARAGEALNELEKYAALRERDRLALIGEMSAGLAHEIRNPLGAIKGAIQVIEPQANDPNAKFLQIIMEEANRLNRVVTQFLDYAKPFRAEQKPVYLLAVLEPLLRAFAERVKQEPQPIEFSWSIDPQAPPRIWCQPDLLAQVVANLLENSLTALRSKKIPFSPTLSLKLSHTIRDDYCEVTLTVADNGIGIAPQHLEKIFIPFFTASPKGTGLGLSLCQKIAQAHGGRMEAVSELGDGTQMTLRFPARWEE